jgi:hypothetical protein
MNLKHRTRPVSRGNFDRARDNQGVIRSRDSFRAEAMLHELDRHEAVALRCEAARSELLRQTFAEAYLRLAGVHPSQRSEFRAALDVLRAGGDGTVADLVEHFRVRLQVK